METYHSKKNVYHRNTFFNEYKSNGIIYPSVKPKFSPQSNILNFLKNRKLSSKYILSKDKRNINTKMRNNANIYVLNSKNMNLSLPKNINNKGKNHSTNQSNSLKNQNKNNYINNYYCTDKLNSDTLISNEKKFRNLASSKENIISKENNFYIENKKDNIKDKNENTNKKIIHLIYELWDYLCVPKSYHELFNVILIQLDETNKNILINNEFDELNELKSNIEDLLFVIQMRRDILKELKGMNNRLRLIFNKEAEETNSLLVKQMSNKIEILRDYTIKICFNMKKIKNKIYQGSKIGKYDINIISNKFEFDINYLIKMKEEMNFLKDGNAKYFFNIIEDRTPFLVKASEEDPLTNGDPFIHLVPLSSETKKQIEKCNYIIYQELIGYQNKDFIDNKFRPISPLRHYNRFEKPEIKLNTSCYKNNNNKCPLLRPIKSWFKQAIFDNDINNRIQDINNQNMNSILKENSCINFEIKNNEMQNLLKKKLMTKYLTICNNINTTLGGNNLN
jgi:hypothetical protein